MMKVNGEIVKRYMFRSKMVIIARMEACEQDVYSFRITDKCSKKDYYSDKFTDRIECEKAADKVAKHI
ncbi:MAG: hypothetical protein RR817_10925 [Niameybacter sp.]